jgi:hypothetical protein
MQKFLLVPDISCEFGAIDHYFHFMFGYLLPFIKNVDPHASNEYYFYDCGIMNKLLFEVPQYNIKLFDEKHQENYNRISFKGFDSWPFADLNVELMRSKIFKIFNINRKAINRILIVDRKSPDDYFLTKSKNKGSGASRRSVPNMNCIYDSVRNAFPNAEVLLVHLEDKSLFEQIDLFYNSNCIIVQHGAAMSNLLFCQKNALVIQISEEKDIFFYQTLINKCNLKYSNVVQESKHAAVSPSKILRCLARIYL